MNFDDHTPACWVVANQPRVGASNLGPLLRTCSAFSVRELLVAGPSRGVRARTGARRAAPPARRAAADDRRGPRPRARRGRRVPVRRLRRPVAGSLPVTARPFRGPTAFVVGSAAHGLGAAVRSASAAAEGDDARRALEACDLVVHGRSATGASRAAARAAAGRGRRGRGAAADAASDCSDATTPRTSGGGADEDVEIALDPLATLRSRSTTTRRGPPRRSARSTGTSSALATRRAAAARPRRRPRVARDGNWRTRMRRVPAAWPPRAEDDARARAGSLAGSDDDEVAGGPAERRFGRAQQIGTTRAATERP